MKNGTCWEDQNGKLIQAHGGMILEHEGVFYWYGEHKGAPNAPTTDGKSFLNRVDVIGISCYSSKDLVNWKYEGLALPAQKDDPASPLHPSRVVERPKVLYNRKNRQFVMWMHMDSANYTQACAGCAVSDSPVGPFQFLFCTQPNRRDSRDMTVFEEEDGSAWLVHSGDWNQTMYFSKLNEDYTGFTGECYPAFADQTREAPALIKEKDVYYLVTSGCTGWHPNPALYGTSKHINCGWKLIDNPCVGKGARDTYQGQSTYLFRAGDQVYLMLDHWKPQDLMHSGYSILPVFFSDGRMEIPWKEKFEGLTVTNK